MSDTPFKTPMPYRSTPRNGIGTDGDFYTPTNNIHTDSDESITSTNSDTNTDSSAASNKISIVAEYDDLVRHYKKLIHEKVLTHTTFLDFVAQTKLLHREYFLAVEECRRLQSLVDYKTHECSDLENKLGKARKLLDKEKITTRNVKKERDDLALQIAQVNDLLMKDKVSGSRISEEMRHRLSFLNNNNSQSDWDVGHNQHLSAIKEVNSTGSILSDFSYSRSEDDLDGSLLHNGAAWKKHRPSTGGVPEPAIKKRRSSNNKAVEIAATDTVRATTTVTVCKDGPITATSIIESLPQTQVPLAPESAVSSPKSYATSAPPANLVFESWAKGSPRKPPRNINCRQHSFQQKTVVMPETCGLCEKRIGFGRTAIKCKDCKAVCHVECKDKLPIPCIPLMSTPTQRNHLGVIGDYTPTTAPMVPAILIHCINEIELRGLTEVGLYRIPGAERDVKNLKEKFLKGKGAPPLHQLDIHVICGTVKDFLRSLHEPLVTYALWKDFVAAVEAKDKIDVLPALYQVISELPQPNRDTLAYMILHLQRVSVAKECKMNVSNLARVFGPTIVGYSSEDPDPATLVAEMFQPVTVLENLINIPGDYWSMFVNVETVYQPSKLQQTPSTDSLLRPTNPKSFITPNRNLVKRKQKYFQFVSPKH